MSWSNSSLHLPPNDCIFPEINSMVLSLVVVYIFGAPLFLLVLVVGYQKWRKQCSSSASTSSSHIDIFTYNMVVLDFVCVLGTCLYFVGRITQQAILRMAGNYMYGIFTPGQILFHLVTCVERYLAVVHPVVYLRLRGSCGARIRNATIGCVWLLSFGVVSLTAWLNVQYTMITGLLLSLTSVAFGFCSLSVLCALIRPGPGNGGGTRERDQSKQRALYTMLIISGVLLFRFLGSLIITTVQIFSEPYGYMSCMVGWSSVWFLVPSTLVLPLLFLQREGKLPCCGPKSDESLRV